MLLFLLLVFLESSDARGSAASSRRSSGARGSSHTGTRSLRGCQAAHGAMGTRISVIGLVSLSVHILISSTRYSSMQLALRAREAFYLRCTLFIQQRVRFLAHARRVREARARKEASAAVVIQVPLFLTLLFQPMITL